MYPIFRVPFLFLAASSLFSLICTAAEKESSAPKGALKISDPEIVGEEKAVLTPAPNVPPPIQRKNATKVIVNLEVREVVKRMADGVDYLFWTFGG